MAWQTECVRIIRYLIDDVASPQTYTDSRLEELFLVCAQLVLKEASFTQTYTIDVDEVTLTPDPTDRTANTRDDSFINLVCLKAACQIDHGETKKAIRQGLSIQDMGKKLDRRGAGDNRLKYFELGPCKAYATALLQYKIDRSSVAGAMIMGPFRTDDAR